MTNVKHAYFLFNSEYYKNVCIYKEREQSVYMGCEQL